MTTTTTYLKADGQLLQRGRWWVHIASLVRAYVIVNSQSSPIRNRLDKIPSLLYFRRLCCLLRLLQRSGVSLYNVVYYYRHFALLIALTLGNANLINLHAYAYLSVCLSLGARGVFMASVYRRLKVFRKKWESEWEKHCHRNPSIVSWHWLVASIPSSQWMHEWAN